MEGLLNIKKIITNMSNFNLKSYFTFLSRNKAYTAVNVFGLAVSLMFVIIIGVYTWQEVSVNRQHRDADRIYNIGYQGGDEGSRMANSHHYVLRYLKDKYPEVELTCGFAAGGLKLKDKNGYTNAYVLTSDSTFFSMFDFPLLRGNRATCLMQKGNIVLTESFARRMFGTIDVVGRTLTTVDNTHFRVTGVVADFDNTIIDKHVQGIIDFSFNGSPFNKDEYFPKYINFCGSTIFAKVHEGCDLTTKNKEIDEFFKKWFMDGRCVITRLDKLYFSDLDALHLQIGNYTLVKILFAVGLVILLFSIMNYVNLTVAQSGYRAREMATRRLFGCRKSAVGMNMFAESLVMCVISLAVAIALAYVLAPYAGRLLDTKLDLGVLTRPFTLAAIATLILAVSLVAGLLPATILSRVKPIEVVRGTFRTKTKMVFSRIFITVQNVITIVMLACSAIMSMQMLHLIKAPLGFNTENVINIEYSSGNISVLSKTFEDRLRALPFVKAVAQSQGTPADGGNNATTRFDGEKSPSSFQFINATPELLKIYGLKLETDLHVKGDSIVYLNEKAMKQLKMKPTDTHLNNRYRQIRYSYLGRNPRLGGIVSDFRIRNILVEPCAMIIQLCNKVEAPWEVSILVEGDPAEAYAKIKKVYREVFHEDVEEESDPFVDKQVEAYFEKEIRTTKIVSLFAVAAIIISMLGLVAMSTYFIQQRAREIAIRKVFGSTGNQVRRRLISTFMTYVAVAFVIAVPIVVHFMGNWIEQYNYRITWWPWIIAAGAAVMAISYAAVAVQSRAAANENPVKNIRQE